MLALADLPVLGICGWSGSGKTTLIESVVPVLLNQGLTVAVLKHDVHGVQVDRSDCDTTRLFACGADVILHAPNERLIRLHGSDSLHFERTIFDLAFQYDLVLVEGFKQSAVPKIWLKGPDGKEAPPDTLNLLAGLEWNASRREALLSLLGDWLPKQWRKTPLFGCVLIGGKSTRMGRAKHLIITGGETWLERIVRTMQIVTDRCVIAGAGIIPDSLPSIPRLLDIPDGSGPLAGVLTAMRWAPQASWLVAACDQPHIHRQAVEWLIAARTPGKWITLPRLAGADRVEPLLALYDPRARPILEELNANREFSLQRLATHVKVQTPTPPDSLVSAWTNINTEQELTRDHSHQ